MADKNRASDSPETSIPAGVYPELDRDLGRRAPMTPVPGMNLGLWPNSPWTVFPLGVYPVFDNDLPRDNDENNITAAHLQGTWPDALD